MSRSRPAPPHIQHEAPQRALTGFYRRLARALLRIAFCCRKTRPDVEAVVHCDFICGRRDRPAGVGGHRSAALAWRRMDHALPKDGTKVLIEGGAWRGQIVRWLVDGARLYLEHGEGEVPKSVADEVARWQADNDTVALFAEATHMEADAGSHVVIGELREAFVRWARKNDVKMAPQALTDALCGEPWNARREKKNGQRVLSGVSAMLSDLPF